MASMIAVSRRRGEPITAHSPAVSSVAASIGKVAFLAPLMRTSP